MQISEKQSILTSALGHAYLLQSQRELFSQCHQKNLFGKERPLGKMDQLSLLMTGLTRSRQGFPLFPLSGKASFPFQEFSDEKTLTPFESSDSELGQRQATSWSKWLDKHYPFQPDQGSYSQKVNEPLSLKSHGVINQGNSGEYVRVAQQRTRQGSGENKEIFEEDEDRFSDPDEGGLIPSYEPPPEIKDHLSYWIFTDKVKLIRNQEWEKGLKEVEEFEKNLDLPRISNQLSDEAPKNLGLYFYGEIPTSLTPTKRRTRPERRKPENVKRRKAVWNILVEEYGEDLDPNQLTPTDVYEVLAKRSMVRKLYEPSRARLYKKKSPKNPERASIKHRISSDLRYLPPE